MANYTLLDTVNKVLSDMGEDIVPSIYSSDEAREVASLATDVYSAILTEYPWVLKESIITPLKIDKTTISLPKTSQRIIKIRYSRSGKCGGNTSNNPVFDPGFPRQEEWTPCLSWSKCVPQTYLTTNYTPSCNSVFDDNNCVEIKYLKMEDFLMRCKQVNKQTCDECMVGDYHIYIPTNKDPEFWTEIDGKVVLDSYCSLDGNRIMEQRLLIIGQTAPELKLQDLTTVDLPVEFYNYFLAELKSTAFYTIKERANEKEESRAQRLRRALLRQNGLGKRHRTNVKFDYGAGWRK